MFYSSLRLWLKLSKCSINVVVGGDRRDTEEKGKEGQKGPGREQAVEGGRSTCKTHVLREWCEAGMSTWLSSWGPYPHHGLLLCNPKLRTSFTFSKVANRFDKEYVTETIGIRKSKIFTLWAFTEKFY